MIWKEAVRAALQRYSQTHQTKVIERQAFIQAELPQIIVQTGSRGQTPEQTLSRVLQELRDEDFLYFTDNQGTYLLCDETFAIEHEDLPDVFIDHGLQRNLLRFTDLSTAETLAVTRQRRGQARLRAACLQNYYHTCAFCDIREEKILVVSHIVRWADNVEARGNLANVLCTCRFHDTLFEYGYLGLTDDYRLLKRPPSSNDFLSQVLALTQIFSPPANYKPAPAFLAQHRKRVQLE